MKRLCAVCRQPIPAARVKAMPTTETCVAHSTVRKKEGLVEYGHKTAGCIVLLPDDPESRRRAFRAYRRAR